MKTKQEKSYLSHRVLSKFLLKRFTDVKRMIHYYDIEKRTIESAYPKFFNTEPNFFSAEIEDFLSRNIEKPSSDLFTLMCRMITQNLPYTHSHNNAYARGVIIKYYANLLVRSNQMQKHVKEACLFDFENEQILHDVSVYSGYHYAVADLERHFAESFISLIYIPNEQREFILPSSGYYTFLKNCEEHYILIIDPQIAIDIARHAKPINTNYISNSEIDKMNRIAFEHQLNLKEGQLISRNKELLEQIAIG